MITTGAIAHGAPQQEKGVMDMWSLLSRFLGAGMEKVILGMGAIAALAAMYWRAWSGGAKRERERQEARSAAEMAEAHGKRVDTMKTAQEARDAADNATDDDVADRLRRWTRD